MKCLSGYYHFPLYTYTCQEPDRFSLFLPDAIIEINNRERFFEFVIKSNTIYDDEFGNLVSTSKDGIGFFLDIQLGSAYSTPSQLCDGNLSPINRVDEILSFELQRISVNLDFTEIKIPLNKTIHRSELESFISSLRHNELLWCATSYYLEAIEKPEVFSMLLYKAYDIIKKYVEIPEKKKFKRLTNDSSIFDSRHAEKPPVQLRSLTPDERNFCQSTIKEGILSYSNSLNKNP